MEKDMWSNMRERMRVMMDYIQDHEDATAAEVADATGYTAHQVRSDLRRARRHQEDGRRFYSGKDHSRKGSPIVYWFGREKLRGSLQKQVLESQARYEKGVATSGELYKAARWIELAEGKEEALKWWQRAKEKEDKEKEDKEKEDKEKKYDDR